MRKLLLASNNQGKQREMTAILSDLGISLVTPQDLGLALEVVEDGDSYQKNAALKAVAFAQEAHMPVLADDSGLEVDALNGAPGLHSARFSPKPGAADADRRAHLLAQLEGQPRPWTARFRCTAALALPGEDPLFREGVCPGEIIPEERGTGGFGYDPLFLIPHLGLTMAELAPEQKNRLSHRAKAINAARPLIIRLFNLD